MRASILISALVAVLVGFGGSVAIVLAAAKSVAASVDQTSSWIAALCLSMMVTTAILSFRHRMPIITAWSTPGAALIASSSGISIEAAVGAFMFAAVLVLLTAKFKPLARLIESIPVSIAAAMLAGVLFAFVVDVFNFLQSDAQLVLPLLLAFLLIRLYSPVWSVLTVLGLGLALAYGLDLVSPTEPLRLSSLVWVQPDFEVTTLLSLGIPLYLVTMASQNLPGFAVLKAAGYQPPTRSILTVTGLLSLLTAGFGAHASNLAAITASICTGEEAHPEPNKRWLCGPLYALGYAILALFGASLVALFASFPEALIVTIASIALAGPLVSALSASLSRADAQFTAVTTFVVTASGFNAFGLGAAFWGLLAGLAMLSLHRVKRYLAVR